MGFIDEENYYADDYLYLIKSDIDSIEDFGERVKFLLENIDVYENPNMQFIDRQWHHKEIIEKFFSRKEFNYESNNKKIRMLNCYKDIKGIRHYVNCISVQTESGMDIYVYNKKEYCCIWLNFYILHFLFHKKYFTLFTLFLETIHVYCFKIYTI